ncbi:MAG: DUF2828 family protein [Lachnospiraceae bacterium]|nr:DUF2828 family protein [Lachnospiraceae bacterium]
MHFADILREQSNKTYTENGALALNTTGTACLDLFGSIGSLREADEARITGLFAEAYRENPLMAIKIAFYGRDIREGLGERKTFRTILKFMAWHHPEALKNNLGLIGVYGRYDDLYALIGTPLEEDMWQVMKQQFEADYEGLQTGGGISLLAKWIKTADASSKNTRQLGILTAKKLGYSVYEFKRMVRALRKEIGIVEAKMSANEWEDIAYNRVPSRAMMIYRNAFLRHNEEGFAQYIKRASKGEEVIHSAALYPYDLTEKFLSTYGYGRREPLSDEEKKVLEAQWNQLPDYVGGGINAIVMADVSGSMMVSNGRPMASSIGLAIYFAERNHGDYHNLFMTFSADPQIVELRGETLEQKISFTRKAEWGMNTNLKAAFDKVLSIAVKCHTPAEDMPTSIIVISDMEIDQCNSNDWTFYDQMQAQYRSCGYEIPNIVFWNVNSRHDVFHADSRRQGVQLVSGQSAATFKQLMRTVGMTPVEAMTYVIDSERYEPITLCSCHVPSNTPSHIL